MNGEFESIVDALARGGGAERLASEVRQLTAASQLQVSAVFDNTQAILQNTIALAMGGGAASGGGIAATVWKTLGGGLGVAPLVTGLLKLFGVGKSEAPAPLPIYVRPAPVEVQSALSRSGASESEVYVQAGRGAPQVTVQVRAMDSRSFLDHRDEIARAVREAMLNSHSLNDIMNDL